jgi:protein-disulfide isomerase
MAKQEFNKRIQESIYSRRRKHWYNFFLGKVAILAGFIVLFFVSSIGWQTVKYYRELAAGDVESLVVDVVEQGARVDLLHNGDDPSLGPADANVVIVAFEDFQCPFCFQAQPFIKKLRTVYADDVRFIYKDFPLAAIHPEARNAAAAAQCAREQGKFWEYHDELFANQGRLAAAYYRSLAQNLNLNINQFNECYRTGKYSAAVSEDFNLGVTLGVKGTPTFFINGEKLAEGYSSELDDQIEKAIAFIRGL